LDYVLDDNPKKWQGGSGDASLTHQSSKTEQTLTFMFRTRYGYILTYCSENATGREFFYSSSGPATGNVVSVFVGGDFFNFDESLFVEKPSIVAAVEQFMGSEGSRPTCIEWIDEEPPLPNELLYGDKY
jgi:hypothetical protein